jgi:hypothetical protein
MKKENSFVDKLMGLDARSAPGNHKSNGSEESADWTMPWRSPAYFSMQTFVGTHNGYGYK